jgi:myo-inositol-1(or 4)-monophosphatase
MSTQELLDIAKHVARVSGEMVLERRQGHVEVADTKSTLNDVVTQVDRDSEQLIKDMLQTARPQDGFLGEEGGSGESTSGITWVVDPIDGTVNFLYGIPHYAVSIAAVEGQPEPDEWNVLAGVVFNPATGEMFHAAQGKGAHLGNRSITVAAQVPIENALLLTGFAYAERYRRAQGELMQEILPRVRDIRRLGTASLDLAYVAAGRANVYFERTLSPWDHAAGELIVREAGGVVTGFGETAPGREAIFAGERDMVARMKELVSQFDGDRPLSSFDS